MSYLYEQRKRPSVADKAPPLAYTARRGPDAAPRMPGPADSAAPSPDLDAAMRERMTNTFGDLSALRDYQPPVREAAPAQAGPYTGPVTHSLSAAAPSPAAADPMQARRGKKVSAKAMMKTDAAQTSTLAAMEGSGPGRTKSEMKRLDRAKAEKWKKLKKTMSPGEFYDMLSTKLLSDTGVDGLESDDVPDLYRDWFFEHRDKGSRWSGKKGWGTPEEHERELARQKQGKERMEKWRRKYIHGHEDEEGEFL